MENTFTQYALTRPATIFAIVPTALAQMRQYKCVREGTAELVKFLSHSSVYANAITDSHSFIFADDVRPDRICRRRGI